MSQTEENKLPIPINEADHAVGPPDAKVTLVEYGDYECGDCRKMNRAMFRMAQRLATQVRFVYRHFPLFDVHPHALRSAEASEAAAAQNKFWEMHKLLFKNPDKLSDKDLRHYAGKIGLDLKRYDDEMTANIYADKIREGREASIIKGISGAPTFYLNGELSALTGSDLLNTVSALVAQESPEEHRRINLKRLLFFLR